MDTSTGVTKQFQLSNQSQLDELLRAYESTGLWLFNVRNGSYLSRIISRSFADFNDYRDGHTYAFDTLDNSITTFHPSLQSSKTSTVNFNREILTEAIVSESICLYDQINQALSIYVAKKYPAVLCGIHQEVEISLDDGTETVINGLTEILDDDNDKKSYSMHSKHYCKCKLLCTALSSYPLQLIMPVMLHQYSHSPT
jgi:hypothetical protein